MYPIAMHFSLPLWCIITVYPSQKYNLGSNFPANRWRCCVTNAVDGSFCSWNRTARPRGFFRVNTVAVQWSQWNPNLPSCSLQPAPPQRSDFQSQLLVPKKHGHIQGPGWLSSWSYFVFSVGFLFGKVNFVISYNWIWLSQIQNSCMWSTDCFQPTIVGFLFF